jgi:hypothetical protein
LIFFEGENAHPSSFETQQKQHITNVKADEEKLQQSVNELQKIFQAMSVKNAESRSIASHSNVSYDWNEEREALMDRLLETERTLVLVASQNEELERKTAEEKESLKNRLTATEKALFAVESQKQLLEKKNSSLEIKLRSPSPLSLPPRPPQSDMSAELGRLQLSFLREKKEMLERQQGLEKMLMEALSFDKENAMEMPTTPHQFNSAKKEETRDCPETSVRITSRSRLPLSPTGSTTMSLKRRGRSIDP